MGPICGSGVSGQVRGSTQYPAPGDSRNKMWSVLLTALPGDSGPLPRNWKECSPAAAVPSRLPSSPNVWPTTSPHAKCPKLGVCRQHGSSGPLRCGLGSQTEPQSSGHGSSGAPVTWESLGDSRPLDSQSPLTCLPRGTSRGEGAACTPGASHRCCPWCPGWE